MKTYLAGLFCVTCLALSTLMLYKSYVLSVKLTPLVPVKAVCA